MLASNVSTIILIAEENGVTDLRLIIKLRIFIFRKTDFWVQRTQGNMVPVNLSCVSARKQASE